MAQFSSLTADRPSPYMAQFSSLTADRTPSLPQRRSLSLTQRTPFLLLRHRRSEATTTTARSCSADLKPPPPIVHGSVDEQICNVNPANERMLGGAGADGAIHRAAGRELRTACYDVREVRPGIRCPTGEARITLGFKLPASHVIHTVGPIYNVDPNPEASLRSAYRSSLRVAKQNNIQYIAYTAISCGNHRYPLDEAATIAISTVRELANDFKEVHFVLYTDETYNVWLNKANELLLDQ